jgi:hypothetical protein
MRSSSVSLSKKILIGLMALVAMVGVVLSTASASTSAPAEKSSASVMAWDCPYDHICFYSRPDGEGGATEIFPWYVQGCLNLEEPAASVYNRTRSRTATVYVNQDCDDGWGNTKVGPDDKKNLANASWSFEFTG